MTTGHQWISALPDDLTVQRALLHRLLDVVEADSRWDWLELGCSVAEGRADAWSDLDVGLGHATPIAPAVEEVTAMLAGLGPVVEVSVQPFDGMDRWWVQYTDGAQLDLVLLAADSRPGRAPGAVALLDRSGRLAEPFTPSVWAAGPGDAKNWLLDGWEALSNVAKYLHRGSVLEAVEQLHRARGRVFQLWAAGEGVPYPVFGLVSLLDHPAASLPPDIDGTYPRAGLADTTAAAFLVGSLLPTAAEHAQPGLHTPLEDYVMARLRLATAGHPGHGPL